jgi:pyruvate dehydrogenase E1 component
LHPEQSPRIPYVARVLGDEPFPVVATCDYMKAVPDQIARWVPQGLRPLGADGFGRSEARAELRDYFEIDARYATLAALQELARIGKFDRAKLADARRSLDINPDKTDPTTAPSAPRDEIARSSP